MWTWRVQLIETMLHMPVCADSICTSEVTKLAALASSEFVCQQVLRHPAEHGILSMGKHIMAKAHLAKQTELTDKEGSECTQSIVDEQAWAILKRLGSWGIIVVRSKLTLLLNV
jgi:hypothetical protein